MNAPVCRTAGTQSLSERIGIFCLPVADPRSDELARAAIHTVISDIAFSRSHGLSFAWTAEHHNSAYGGCIPDPLTFAAAVGQLVPGMALGTAVLLAPLRHPVMILEQARLVSRLVGSEVHLGLGRGFLPCDQADFGLTPSEATRRFWEAVNMISRAERHAFPRSNIWVATTQLEGARTVGELGLGLALNPYTRSQDETDRSIDAYRTGFQLNGHAGTPQVLIHEALVLASTQEAARTHGNKYFAAYLQTLKDAERATTADALEPRHQLGADDYAARCPFLDEAGFRQHMVSWTRRGVTHWCFQMRFGNISDSVVRETIARCGNVARNLRIPEDVHR